MVNRLNHLYSKVIQYARVASDTLLTGQCILCGGSSQKKLDLCPACENSLCSIQHCCIICSLPLLNHSQTRCGECLQHPPPFSHTQSCWVYEFPVAQLVAAFKYQRKLGYGQTMAKLSAKHLEKAYSQRQMPDIIIATPLHWRRHLLRGFNQSELLARYYSSYFQIPLFNGVKRKKKTEAQQSLTAKERRNNLQNAFSISNTESIEGKLVVVVDDVMTTGATAKEISQTLLIAGAKEVHIWVLARTPQ